jgi:hypothetical protein
MNRIHEFWYSVASQEDLPLYKGHAISSDVCDKLIQFIDYFKSERLKSKNLKEIISEALLTNPEMIKDIRLLLGISDKRLYLDLTYLVNFTTLQDGSRLVNESRENLIKHDTKFFINQLKRSTLKKHYADLISDYFLAKGIEEILVTFANLDNDQIIPIFNNLIAPKEIQQKQAKYRGHGAEMAFAKVFADCGVTIFPENKHTDPMAGYDPNVDLSKMEIVSKDISNPDIHSFDLVIKDNNDNIKVLVQSLIHSSDPGQYGVDKSNETVIIKDLIDQYNASNPEKHVYLLGSVDGVGFCENPNGTIVKMIDVFDEFFQMNTLFKIGVFLHKIGLIENLKGVHFDESFFGPEAITHFEENYLRPLNLVNFTHADTKLYKTIPAGKGFLVFETT